MLMKFICRRIILKKTVTYSMWWKGHLVCKYSAAVYMVTLETGMVWACWINYANVITCCIPFPTLDFMYLKPNLFISALLTIFWYSWSPVNIGDIASCSFKWTVKMVFSIYLVIFWPCLCCLFVLNNFQLRMMQAELNVEEIVRDRSLKVICKHNPLPACFSFNVTQA